LKGTTSPCGGFAKYNIATKVILAERTHRPSEFIDLRAQKALERAGVRFTEEDGANHGVRLEKKPLRR